MVKGINAAREFKTIKENGEIEPRKPQFGEAEELLSAVIDASEAEEGVDNITLNMTMQQLAKSQSQGGKKKEAKLTMKRMVDIFKKKQLATHVLNLIEEQANEVIKEL